MTEYVAIVGSRNVPENILTYLIRIGRTYTDMGVGVSSGDAYGADRAGWYGSKQSRMYEAVGARIYLDRNGRNGRDVYTTPYFYNARDLHKYRDVARTMAFEARGSFQGLYQSGIELHTRNVYQIHGHDLDNIVIACIFYAEPNGKSTVKGGTNTAFQLAKTAKVPTIVNLYTREGIQWAEAFLAKHEKDYPYVDIDWREIHDPKDPRLTEFEE